MGNMGQVDTIQINMLDKRLVQDRFGKNMTTYNQAATVQKAVCTQLSQELKRHLPNRINRVLEIGCGTGFLTQMLAEWMIPDTYYANDLVPNAGRWVQRYFENSNTKFEFLAGDGEHIPYPQELNAIVTTSAIQWFQNFNYFTDKARNALSTHGVLAFATFGQNNFKEIRDITGAGLEYLSLEEHLDALLPHYTIEFQQESKNEMVFNNSMEVLRHIKHIGANGITTEKWTPKTLHEFLETYSGRFTNSEGKAILTYHPILIIARKK